MIKTYTNQVKTEAAKAGVDLKLAFAMAGLPESSYYRFKRGEQIRYHTALRVMTAISWLNAEPDLKYMDGKLRQGGK